MKKKINKLIKLIDYIGNNYIFSRKGESHKCVKSSYELGVIVNTDGTPY